MRLKTESGEGVFSAEPLFRARLANMPRWQRTTLDADIERCVYELHWVLALISYLVF